MALTETEGSLVRRYLGYPNWENLALAWGLSFPTAIEPSYYINNAMDRITDEGEALIRRDLRELQTIENQISEARCRLKAVKIGDITLNSEEIPALRGEMNHWKNQLADDFGSILNPFRKNVGGSRNGSVVG